MVDVFISYSRENQALVRQLAEAVKREGYSVWWDDELPPHLSYGDVITEKIGAAKAAIVVWSASAAASEWVRAESDVARSQKKLIQVSIDDRMPPMPFNQIQFASIGGWQGEDDHPGWRKVKASLAALCGPPAGGPAHPLPATPPPVHVPPPPPPPPPEPTVPTVVTPAAAASAPARGNAYLVPMLAALALLVLIAAGAFFFLRGGGDSVAAADEAGNGAAAAAPGARARTDERFTQAATAADARGYAEVRSGASSRAFVVARVNRGEIFVTYPQDSDWWQVRLADGRTGYLARSSIRVIDADAAAPQQAEGAPPPGDIDTAEAEPAAAGPVPEQVIPDSSQRLLDWSEAQNLSPAQARIARNEIFARHGRPFRDPDLRRHFSRYPWYRPRGGPIALSRIEQANVRLLQQAETQ